MQNDNFSCSHNFYITLLFIYPLPWKNVDIYFFIGRLIKSNVKIFWNGIFEISKNKFSATAVAEKLGSSLNPPLPTGNEVSSPNLKIFVEEGPTFEFFYLISIIYSLILYSLDLLLYIKTNQELETEREELRRG